ncbi:hypothetical protein CFP56_043058 [Quercus suber]|uniref:Uncharacterized protein n=1 Tax=Quercus suber TaxID=58331 RepID=A0AAW0IS51_QUESU
MQTGFVDDIHIHIHAPDLIQNNDEVFDFALSTLLLPLAALEYYQYGLGISRELLRFSLELTTLRAKSHHHFQT